MSPELITAVGSIVVAIIGLVGSVIATRSTRQAAELTTLRQDMDELRGLLRLADSREHVLIRALTYSGVAVPALPGDDDDAAADTQPHSRVPAPGRRPRGHRRPERQ
ncbi:hypothetical protein [Pseudonocardia alni]|uniref:hypothetical protein n=1 Tax=Pseudonocardia alni TaxID=33907 RepID=UPI00331F0F4B